MAQVAWHENNGDQTFTEHIITDTAEEVSFAVAADVKGDGSLDVVAAVSDSMNVGGGTIELYVNDGAESFTVDVIANDAPHVIEVRAADMDGDSDLDVIFSV